MKASVKFTVKTWVLIIRCRWSELWCFCAYKGAVYCKSAPHCDSQSAVESDTESAVESDTQSAESDTQSVLVFFCFFPCCLNARRMNQNQNQRYSCRGA